MFLKYLNFCPGLFGHVLKRLEKKANVRFKIYDVMNWKANSYKTNPHCPISQEVKANNESDNEILSVKDTINPLQLFIFTNVIRCSRLPL